ncbi:MAG: HAD family hydrolase [Pseudomonadota bacterium]
MRIAMWSGPRNLSTAMMYAFGARSDCAVIDEPFYAAYLSKTGLRHPMRDEILAAQPVCPKDVVHNLLGPVPRKKAHFYQKHMAQHMIDGIPRNWISELTNVFLIRHPVRVAASFSSKFDRPTLADIGFEQQVELFDLVKSFEGNPVVIDSADIRRAPETMLRQLCTAVGLSWDPAMLSWPKGGHPDDGVWAQHWYASVHASTGFSQPETELPKLAPDQQVLADAAMPFYEILKQHAL